MKVNQLCVALLAPMDFFFVGGASFENDYEEDHSDRRLRQEKAPKGKKPKTKTPKAKTPKANFPSSLPSNLPSTIPSARPSVYPSSSPVLYYTYVL
jgi:hypothetical protein